MGKRSYRFEPRNAALGRPDAYADDSDPGDRGPDFGAAGRKPAKVDFSFMVPLRADPDDARVLLVELFFRERESVPVSRRAHRRRTDRVSGEPRSIAPQSGPALIYFSGSFFGVNSDDIRWAAVSWDALSFLAIKSRWLSQPAFPLAAQMLSHL
jgi:hypothetical protein